MIELFRNILIYLTHIIKAISHQYQFQFFSQILITYLWFSSLNPGIIFIYHLFEQFLKIVLHMILHF